MLCFDLSLERRCAIAFATLSLLVFPALSPAQGLSSETKNKTEQIEHLQPLIQASAKRLALAHQVAFAKWDNGSPVEDIPREEQVIEAVASQAKQQGVDEKFATSFFRAQIEANKIVQYGLLADWYRSSKAPDHSKVDLKQTIRPQLDDLQTTLLSQLHATSDIRGSADCHKIIASAVGSYVKGAGKQVSALDSIALDRSMSSFCAR